MRVIAIQGVNSPEPKQLGAGWTDSGVMYTLNQRDQHIVAWLPEETTVDNAAEQLSIFSLEEPHASHSQSQDSEKDWMTRVATSCLPILQLLQSIGPSGWFGRTSPACYPVTEDSTLPAYFEGWANAGMGSPTEFLTLSILEWPKDAAVCLLSDVLEDGNVPQRFFLSATACKGILRRAEKRGKSLPRPLQEALEAAAQSDKTKE